MPFSLTLSENDWSLSVSKSLCDKFILFDLAFTFLGRAGRTHDEGVGDEGFLAYYHRTAQGGPARPGRRIMPCVPVDQPTVTQTGPEAWS